MGLTGEDSMGQPGRWQRVLSHVPMSLAIVAAVLTIGGFVIGLSLIASGRPNLIVWGGVVVSISTLLVLGAGLCGVLLLAHTVVEQISQLSDRTSSLDQRTAVMAEHAVAQSQRAAAAGQQRLEPELRTLLLEIRETLLLSEPERQRRFERLVQREFQRGLATAEQLVASRDFARARETLVMLGERFGVDDRIREMQEKLDRAAELARTSDITEATRRVEDQMSMARWDDAEAIARDLAEKYPLSADPAGLIIRVQRERKLYEQRNRLRLHDEIQQLVRQRRWQQAVAAARKFIENFPVGLDADALRGQMETLQANADIELRQQLEQQLKEYIRSQQYWDALGLARRILNEHPLSPQANALRGQIGRLEELARRLPPPA